ncbi:hypothetical protein [Parafrankia sp. FMc2]|uniref:hypothetical protein n=1 Tax=Parafrankia sp. FMc2 TaxID=3233196 RepID=UPI0034D5ACAC
MAKKIVGEVEVITGCDRRAMESMVLDDAVAAQGTVTQLIIVIRLASACSPPPPPRSALTWCPSPIWVPQDLMGRRAKALAGNTKKWKARGAAGALRSVRSQSAGS